jgi:hypothetical protein
MLKAVAAASQEHLTPAAYSQKKELDNDAGKYSSLPYNMSISESDTPQR